MVATSPLRRALLGLALLVLAKAATAQSPPRAPVRGAATPATAELPATDVGYRMAPNKDVTQIDFLANYYSQEGDFGAVQGGRGTEELTNVAGITVVTVPLDSNSALGASAGVDYYSSASTDRIDRQLSTASSSDVRAYGSVTYTERDLDDGRTYRLTAGTSQEYDYSSFNAGVGFTQEWGRGIDELSFFAQAFLDRWDLIYPIELRRRGALDAQGPLPQNDRQSFGLSAVYARIVNRRVQLALTVEGVAMRGLLSTPFHRVYFRGSVSELPDLDAVVLPDADDVERLPDTRYKFPVSLRVNYKPNDALALRAFARYYADTWGVRGASAEAELAYDATEAWTVMPFARVYRQSGADYYAGYAQHVGTETFYTSDFDLASFTTYKVGLGVRYAPVLSLGRSGLGSQILSWREVSIRGAYYTRDPGLEAFALTLGTRFDLRQRPGGKKEGL